MLNTQKLLYILPEVAFIAELLPAKKPTTFKIQNFHQINGEFMDDNEFIPQNILKLFEKIEAEEYQLILPDFLFTNTIVGVKESSDSKIKTYLKDKLLPELGITTDEYEVDTTVLTEHGDTHKVQISALEKSLLQPIQLSAAQVGIKIAGISPLSWTLKSLVSLEPSISVVQAGDHLYSALHYIGIDQTSFAPIAEVDAIYETIKTLKGGEPSIQTVYLLTDETTENALKEKLGQTIPLQQLAQNTGGDSQMPAHTRSMIETSMRTLSIEDYPAPSFALGQAPAGAKLETKTISKAETAEKETEAMPKTEEAELPTPNKSMVEETMEPEETAVEEAEVVEEKLEPDEKAIETEPETVMPDEKPEMTSQEPEVEDTSLEESDDKIDELLTSFKTEKKPEKENTSNMDDIKTDQPKKVIKNQHKTKTMMKMIFVTLAVFFATVGVGIGIGMGVLQLTQGGLGGNEAVSPIAEVSPSPEASPLPSPSPEPEINKEDLSILVVNATTTPGYAGKTADTLTDDGYGEVDAGNASGDYDEGTYVLILEENTALISLLEETTGLSLEYSAEIEVEDSTGDYDAVIVLAE